jgi:hypothetical protein
MWRYDPNHMLNDFVDMLDKVKPRVGDNLKLALEYKDQ